MALKIKNQYTACEKNCIWQFIVQRLTADSGNHFCPFFIEVTMVTGSAAIFKCLTFVCVT